ncbi:MAG: 4Fe-4S binding protein [Bacteroidales bacterium]
MKKNFKKNPYRLILQLSVLLFLAFLLIRPLIQKNSVSDFEAYCPFGGLMALSSFLVNNSLACSMTSVQIAMGLVLLAGVILFSKLFCSFICPLGTFSEWLGKVGQRMGMLITVKGTADLALRLLKYILLFIVVYFTIGSSELFCRKFDPFFAAMSGFNPDVSVIMATIAIILLVAGSFFIRLFWCKYICPLGSLSNIFRLFPVFAVVFGVYFILMWAGVELSWVWPAAAACELAFLIEILMIEKTPFPVLRVRRDEDLCTGCRLCTVNCPQAIDVAVMKDVKHIDCHLCGDCIGVCPEKGALKFNRSGRIWLPAALTILLIASGFIAGRSFEIPTLSLYWGESGKKQDMQILEKTGLKNVKCYGSSMAFSNQVRQNKGVTGVTTYAGTHTVKVLYDPAVTDSLEVLNTMFAPVKVNILASSRNINVDEFKLFVDNFFDPLDTYYLSQMLSGKSGVAGFITSFDCPVKVIIYTTADSGFDEKSIKELVESKELVMKEADGSQTVISTSFKVRKIELSRKNIGYSDYMVLIGSTAKKDSIQ